MWFYQLLYILGSLFGFGALILVTIQLFKDADDTANLALALFMLSLDVLILGSLFYIWGDLF